jgi:hypothetical protein
LWAQRKAQVAALRNVIPHRTKDTAINEDSHYQTETLDCAS